MNTLPPFPLLKKPGVRDPLACLRSFLAKVKALALRRGDHGSVLEHNVLGRFVAAEADLRDAGAKTVELIARKIGALQDYRHQAMADGKLSPAEDRELRRRIDALYADLIALGAELKSPALTA
jgi:hypothetical protein